MWKDGKCGGGKEREKRGHNSRRKMCVFALLQWPHLPLHPVKEAQSTGGGVVSPPSTSHTYALSLFPPSLRLIHTLCSLRKQSLKSWIDHASFCRCPTLLSSHGCFRRCCFISFLSPYSYTSRFMTFLSVAYFWLFVGRFPRRYSE